METTAAPPPAPDARTGRLRPADRDAGREVTRALGDLTSLHGAVIDYSLERMDRLLADLGRPERRLPAVIHVAGTNGKGSTLAIMRTLLEAGGRRVHSYTSPHLVRFNERIRLAGAGGSAPVADAVLAEALGEVLEVNGGQPLTFFEGTTAAALLLFARLPAEVVLLETGLGGRCDATNVVPEPAATVITSLSYDHQAFLGRTIISIALEKAGIFRRGVPAVLARQDFSEAARAIARAAAQIGAPLRSAGSGFDAEPCNGGFSYVADGRTMDLPLPGLAGRYQIDNAAAAIAALEAAGLAPSREVLARALPLVRWPGRLQRVEGGFGVRLARGASLLVDGGHNPGAAQAVAAEIARLDAAGPRRNLLVFGMLATKNPAGFLRPYRGLVEQAVAVPLAFAEGPAFSCEELCASAADVGIACRPASSLDEAMELAARLAGRNPARIVVSGSLYLAGEVLARAGQATG
ncbi:bifunctional folylpolyglutamate synthase/dihydrofolate synthase [Ancylobacter mangrovi]|uniref:bifunctional folylpolyglutamate synthase/dihydrofolate synthase n=1 Tax=Ancylobacter mangrovi TaxID=2972472 RepID=UPI002161FEAD|nr:Mur ligase family protein [Ancylobacter mangrovi]MCS0502917.1 Mur ligase family protein [Ancylobacter mangrovi]